MAQRFPDSIWEITGMIDALTTFINSAGWLAPLYYIGSFVITALLPFIPTPLVAALGGTAFGFLPATLYGAIGLGLGATISLTVARAIGRPLLQRFVRPEVWANWEQFLGIKSVVTWGLIFLLLNLDFAVTLSGLSTLPLSKLWLAAMIARLPWLLVSAWVGDAVLVNDSVMLVMALLLVPSVYVLGKLRLYLQKWLLRLRPVTDVTSDPSEVSEARIEDVADGVTEEVEADHRQEYREPRKNRHPGSPDELGEPVADH